MAVQTGDRVNFVKLATPADFPSAQDIDDATLYFITSTKEVYLGSILISTGPSVTQTNSDSVNALHELLLSGSADNITRDEGARKTSHLRGNPSDGTLNISGQLTDAYGVQSSRILTQAQYNALPQAEQENGTDYYISDADPTVNQALWNKVGTASLDIGSNLSDAVNALQGITSDTYSSLSTYSEGDYCIYNNMLYKANTDIDIAEQWTPGHWDVTNIGTELKLAASSGGGGLGDTFEWDFTQSLMAKQYFVGVALNDASMWTGDPHGVRFLNDTAYMEFPTNLLAPGMGYEIDIADMVTAGSSSKHRDLFRYLDPGTGANAGLIYRYTGVWAVWDSTNLWQESSITDKSYLDGSTLKVEIDYDGTWRFYKDNVLFFTPPINPVFIGTKSWGIGSPSASLYNMDVTGVRIYKLPES